MLAAGPLTILNHLDEKIVAETSKDATADVHDVPTWRIGDKWVYETQFDVAGLIQQANVSASINTLTGDTEMEITDIRFEMIQGTQTLVYEMDISGDFTSGNSGATLEGTSGRLDIEYEGVDLLRASDLAVWNMEFSLQVEFAPYNLGFLSLELADLTFDTVYEPPREKYDFPLRTGDQWTSSYNSATNVTGTSDYFDPTTFSTPYVEDNTTYQVTSDGNPTEDGSSPPYTGCSDSHKVNAWNNTGSSNGFEWYCDSVRSYAWYRLINPAGFQIDWLLKTYVPADSAGGNAASSPGIRNSVITVEPEFLAILPNATEEITGHFTVGANNEVGKNLQLRYESDNIILSLTTDSNGKVTPDVDVGYQQDHSPSSDDWTSNGVIIWDPVNKIVGAGTIVMDLSVVGVDLVAKPDSMIVTRHRGNDSIILSQASGYNALPGDTLHFSVPAQNRGVLNSPATEMEITTPDGATVRGTLPALSPYSEARVDVNWTVSSEAPIGDQTLSFMVDPDNLVTQDANRSNNAASLEIFIGRMPMASMTLADGVLTRENVIIDATASFDQDGGNVICYFEIKEPMADGVRTEFKDDGSCLTNYSWNDDGMWEVKLIVIDDELDEVELTMYAEILNRDPWVNLTGSSTTVSAGEEITFDASDSGDSDTISPDGQHVTITWPDNSCGGQTPVHYGPYCTIRPEVEGEHTITAVVTDDDNATSSSTFTYEVLNVAPTIDEMRFFIDDIPYLPAEDGTWEIDESVMASLAIDGDDTLSDKENLLITWTPSDLDQNWTETTSGPTSSIDVSWDTAGLHTITVFVTDDDNERSSVVQGFVRVNNVAPVMDTLPAQLAIFENQNILGLTESSHLNATAFDLADQDELVFCWDLNSTVDNDENGDATDDCDFEGANLNYSWSTKGIRLLTANVWDDDGARDSKTVSINVVNQPPKAKITIPEGGFVITQGESISFSGVESSDTPTDRLDLIFRWDDPNSAGTTEDGFGEEYTIEFKRSGTFTVTLTVIDDNGAQDSANVSVKVNEMVNEGFLEGSLGVSDTVAVTGILAMIVIALLAVLLTRVRSSDSEDYKAPAFADSWSQPNDPMATQSASIEEPISQGMDGSGPPIPQTGLPPGWTMEQWNYYGAQYLLDQQAATVNAPLYDPAPLPAADPTLSGREVYQQQMPVMEPAYNPAPTQTFENPTPAPVETPMVQEPAPTPASQALANILDDLDI
jgi:hypothetical protein